MIKKTGSVSWFKKFGTRYLWLPATRDMISGIVQNMDAEGLNPKSVFIFIKMLGEDSGEDSFVRLGNRSLLHKYLTIEDPERFFDALAGELRITGEDISNLLAEKNTVAPVVSSAPEVRSEPASLRKVQIREQPVQKRASSIREWADMVRCTGCEFESPRCLAESRDSTWVQQDGLLFCSEGCYEQYVRRGMQNENE